MKSYKMVLNRDYRVASTMGYVFNFKKGEPRDVPELVVRECVDIGAEFVEDGARDEVFKEPDKDTQPVAPHARREVIAKAVNTIFERNERDDFTATGNPKLNAVGAETGFKIDKGELAQVIKARNEDK